MSCLEEIFNSIYNIIWQGSRGEEVEEAVACFFFFIFPGNRL